MKPFPAAGALRPLVVALTVSLAALAGCNSKGAAPTAAPVAVPAKVLEVQPRSVPIVVEGVGQVEGSKEVEVRARVSGTLKKTLYKEGEVVTPGTTLFQIDPEPFEIALVQARSQLAQEAARNEQMRREAARMKELIG
ncbi:MAG TPA: biotin/lipoyl-binding protein, partial [Usitatibacter sp.]